MTLCRWCLHPEHGDKDGLFPCEHGGDYCDCERYEPLPTHRGLDYARVEGDRQFRPGSLEIAFAEAWEEANDPSRGIGNRHGVLQMLMFTREGGFTGDGICREVIEQRDAAIAASAIQWLGTNVGSSWLAETVKRAGWLLLFPQEAEYYRSQDEDIRRREAEIRTSVQLMREEQGKREQALRTQQAEIEGKRVALMLEEGKLRTAQATFIATALLTSKFWYFTSEPSTDKPVRLIELEDTHAPV